MPNAQKSTQGSGNKKRKISKVLEKRNEAANKTGRHVYDTLDPGSLVPDINIGEQPAFRPKVLKRFFDKSGKFKSKKTRDNTYRRTWKNMDELFSTALTREVTSGIFDGRSPTDLDEDTFEHLVELIDLVSAIRLPTGMSGFSLEDRTMGHPAGPAGRKTAFFDDPYETAAEHARLDGARRDYVQAAMDKAVDDHDADAVEAFITGGRAAIEFTLNYFTAPVTAKNVFKYSKRSGTEIGDIMNQKQLAWRERLKEIYKKLGGKLRPKIKGETEAQSRIRPWEVKGVSLDGSAGFPQRPPSPTRSPLLADAEREEFGLPSFGP